MTSVLERLRAANEARTPGPWKPAGEVVASDAIGLEAGDGIPHTDLEFIALVANAMPDLLRAVEAAQEAEAFLKRAESMCSRRPDCLTEPQQHCGFCRNAVALEAALAPLVAVSSVPEEKR